jgi:diguanylate cyclase (GGDEF)-like protein
MFWEGQLCRVQGISMSKFLIVEDSHLFSGLLRKRIAEEFHIDCVIAETCQQAVDLLEHDASCFQLAILDLNLPGSPDGEIVDLVMAKGIPVVVVTGSMDDQTRDKILKKRVVDYIMKGPHTLDLLSSTIRRFRRSQNVTVLLVDDSSLARTQAREILETQHFNIIEAEDGRSAMAHIRNDPSIRVVVTDYHMPGMNGFELTAEIRKFFAMDRIVIVGMSARGNPLLSAQFLKRGANDFITKPYFEEELIWRVCQNVEMLAHVEQLREASTRDALTGLHNRRYFFQAGEKLFENGLRKNIDLSIAMIDIDHFKRVNDTYGHASGDLVLSVVANCLQQSFRCSDLVVRFGGEEFVVMTSNMDKAHIGDHFESLRKKIEDLAFEVEGATVQVTVSIGVATSLGESLKNTLEQADKLLYQAKDSGRNCVIIR